jgi:hypothetical protein
LKPEQWGLSLVQEKYQEEKACDKRHNNNNEKGTCMLIDVVISGDRNVIKKEAEKILKYKDLTIEIQCMWKVKTRVIAIIIGATGTISKSFRKYISNIPENHEVKELQKTAILGTAHVLRKMLT